MPENPIGRDHLIKLVQALTSTTLDEDKQVLLMAMLVLAADRIGEPSDMAKSSPPPKEVCGWSSGRAVRCHRLASCFKSLSRAPCPGLQR